MASNSPRFVFPDAIRGLAAAWVVLFHLKEGGHIKDLYGQLPAWLGVAVFDSGHLGVPIFFVLSGFVMALTTQKAGLAAKEASRFLLKRLIRLTPPYYAAVVLALALLFLKDRVLLMSVTWPDLSAVFAHLGYAQGVVGVPDLNPVFWTLCVEVQFYLVFAALLWCQSGARLAGSAADVAWLAVAVLSLLWPLGVVTNTGWSGGFIGFWYAFMAGVIMGRAQVGARWLRFAAVGLALALLAVAVYKASIFALFVAITAGLLWLAQQRSGMSHWMGWSWLQRLGLVSYSLYLFHNPVTGVLSNLGHRWWGVGCTADLMVMLASLMGSWFVAEFAYHSIEKPSIAWARQTTQAAVFGRRQP